MTRLLLQISSALPAGWQVFTSPADVAFAWGDVAQPDLVVCAAAGFDLDEGLTAPPECVVEVLSPSTRRYDLVVKRRLYERHGISAYVIVDPETAVLTLLALDADGRLIEVAEGTRIDLARPFPVTLSATG